MPKIIAFIDSEVGVEDKKIHDIGAIRSDGATFHSPSPRALREFLSGVNYICGHNIIHHDLRYLNAATEQELSIPAIDTLYLSPLLFPKRPYHALIKDDKLFTEELNNPLNDGKKAEKLFYDEVNAFQDLPHFLKQIFFFLLYPHPEFKSFFDFLEYRIWSLRSDLKTLIESNFGGKRVPMQTLRH
jgi:ATP-dependent DNA helicase RecQ